ncbi:thiamine-binding protein [Gaoshiqia sediminis]|uniref:Thiamine-binding protein n=1 Tax=Gaoshiqia sediminis TaxID=2986998 RepID=A0AA42CAE6_9BACT|nr:thiamine-binding protein [Gaoshiqia sediminis]MCW0483410.1 thiamine-binding protein [Gaoshiqia sediminis]
MQITVEISYYALIDQYDKPVLELLELLKNQSGIRVEVGTMSTLLSGDYESVMTLVNSHMKTMMKQYPSVFNLKIANACALKIG